MSTFLENREIDIAKSEKRAIDISLDSSKVIFANKLKNGLGENIKNNLLFPPKPRKTDKIIYKMSRFFKVLFFNFKNSITGQNINYYDTESN